MTGTWPDLSKIRGPLNTGTVKDFKTLGDYYNVMINGLQPTAISNVKLDQFIVFNYTAKLKPEEGDLQRWAYVLNPNYEGKLHALEMTLISLDEGVAPPWFKATAPGRWKHSPYNFYHKLDGVKEHIKEHDNYRTFLLDRIHNAKVYMHPDYLETDNKEE